MLTHSASPSRGAIRATRFLLVGPLGLLVVCGVLLFTVIAPTEPLSAADWLVAAIGLALGLASILVGVRLGHATPELRRTASGIVGAHMAFSVMKLIAYDELEALAFLALATLALVALVDRQPRGRLAT